MFGVFLLLKHGTIKIIVSYLLKDISSVIYDVILLSVPSLQRTKWLFLRYEQTLLLGCPFVIEHLFYSSVKK